MYSVAFHSTKNIEVPENIFLINSSPYTPELNPCEQVWGYIKQRFKNQCFENLNKLKQWRYKMVNTMAKETVKSIVSNKYYLNSFYTTFNF